MTMLRPHSFRRSALVLASSAGFALAVGCATETVYITVPGSAPDATAPLTPDTEAPMTGDASAPADAFAAMDAGGFTADIIANATILDIEDHRLLSDPRMLAYLRSENPRVVAQAVSALGRMGARHTLAPEYQTAMLALVPHPDGAVRANAAYALKLFGGSVEHKALALTALKSQLNLESSVRAQGMQLWAVGALGGDAEVAFIEEKIKAATDASVVAAGARALRIRWNAAVTATPTRTLATDDALIAQLLTWVQGSSEEDTHLAAWLLGRFFQVDPSAKTRPIADQLVAAAPLAKVGSARMLMHIASIRSGKPAAVDNFYTAVATDPDNNTRAQLLENITLVPDEDRLYTMLATQVLTSSPKVAVAATDAVLALAGDAAKRAKMAPVFEAMRAAHNATSSAWVRSARLAAMVALNAADARTLVDADRVHSDVWVRAGAIRVLGKYNNADDMPALTAALGDTSPIIMQAGLDTSLLYAPATLSAPSKEALRALVRAGVTEALVTLGISQGVTKLGLTDFGPDLVAAWPVAKVSLNPNTKRGLLVGLNYLAYKDPTALAVVQEALTDDDTFVSRTAAAVAKTLTGIDPSAALPASSRIRTATPDLETIQAALGARVQLETPRGRVVLRMRPEAPLSAVRFVQSVRDGKYNNVYQYSSYAGGITLGMSDTGATQGGVASTLRDEMGTYGNRRGTFGIASFNSRDTGSGQLFFNHIFSPSYDDAFTVLAEVESGLEAADAFEVGDKITSATVLP